MTTTTISRTARAREPHGFDRLVVRLSLATLRWARRRADNRMLAHETHGVRLAEQRDLERRRHDSLRLGAWLR